MAKESKKKIGIVGYGHIGQYLYDRIKDSGDFEVVFVWNRTKDKLKRIKEELILEDLDSVKDKDVDLIVEVAHPSISDEYGEMFVKKCAYFVGSPTALANSDIYERFQKASAASGNAIYVPCGALWGAEDIARMAKAGNLKGLEITMTKHPSSFKLEGDLKIRNDLVKEGIAILYEGPVRDLCPLAPNNVNTMAAAAIAAGGLGFGGTIGRLVADVSIPDWHIIEVKVHGPETDGNKFEVTTIRKNPAAKGAVTGTATFASFFASVVAATGKGAGFHVC